MKNFSKKAAIEMSMSTIVVIVLSVTILIFGMIFVKTIMCSGISMVNGIDEKVTNEIQGLFGTSDYGVRCMGDPGQEAKIGDGGSRQIVCVVNSDTQYTYSFNVKKVESISGMPTSSVQKWIMDQDWAGTVPVGLKTISVLTLNIPKGVSATTLKITLDAINKETDTTDTHIMQINVAHVGQVAATIC